MNRGNKQAPKYFLTLGECCADTGSIEKQKATLKRNLITDIRAYTKGIITKSDLQAKLATYKETALGLCEN